MKQQEPKEGERKRLPNCARCGESLYQTYHSGEWLVERHDTADECIASLGRRVSYLENRQFEDD